MVAIRRVQIFEEYQSFKDEYNFDSIEPTDTLRYLNNFGKGLKAIVAWDKKNLRGVPTLILGETLELGHAPRSVPKRSIGNSLKRIGGDTRLSVVDATVYESDKRGRLDLGAEVAIMSKSCTDVPGRATSDRVMHEKSLLSTDKRCHIRSPVQKRRIPNDIPGERKKRIRPEGSYEPIANTAKRLETGAHDQHMSASNTNAVVELRRSRRLSAFPGKSRSETEGSGTCDIQDASETDSEGEDWTPQLPIAINKKNIYVQDARGKRTYGKELPL